jgi:hypothetical protein
MTYSLEATPSSQEFDHTMANFQVHILETCYLHSQGEYVEWLQTIANLKILPSNLEAGNKALSLSMN